MDIHSNRVWKVEVPVIMQSGGGPACEWQKGPYDVPSDDSPVDPSANWEVIGSVTMAFYDVDIGRASPSRPTNQDGSPLSFPMPSGTPMPAFPAAAAPSPSPHPYGFAQDNGASCNVVRARIIEADSAVQRTNHENRRTVLVQ